MVPRWVANDSIHRDGGFIRAKVGTCPSGDFSRGDSTAMSAPGRGSTSGSADSGLSVPIYGSEGGASIEWGGSRS
jgi:hypothetical protein